MAESYRARRRFVAFLSRIRSYRPLDRTDSESITHLAVSEHKRKEQPIQYTDQETAYEEFLTTGVQTFATEDAGLQSLGWKELIGGPEIQDGGFAKIRMAYKLSDRGTPLESRHLAVAKVQAMFQTTWTEVHILRGLVHKNIIDLYGVFAVDPELRADYGDLWMLLEYANAGDLEKERERYEHKSIPEKGARYYMQQICAGVQYIHSKRVIHKDLHTGNILLKYKPDGTKVCMICDFGTSRILEPDEELDTHTGQDAERLCSILYYLLENLPNVSEEAVQVIQAKYPRDDHSELKGVDELLAYSWFKRSSSAPVPKTPTPLLHPDAVREIGYLPPMDPAGTTSPPVGPQFGPLTRKESRPAPIAQRMRRNLRAFPGHVAARFRSMTGRARQPSTETHPTAHGREQEATVARSPSTESSRVREQRVEEERRGAAAAEPGPSRRSRDRQPSSEHGSAHGREQVASGHRSPPTESLRVREQHVEEEPHGTAEAEPDLPSRTGRVRDRLTSMGRAIARPFRRSSRRHSH